jgi:hypothetical protein
MCSSLTTLSSRHPIRIRQLKRFAFKRAFSIVTASYHASPTLPGNLSVGVHRSPPRAPTVPASLIWLGVIVGAGVSVWASKFVATLLYGLEPRDPAALVGAAAILGAVGVFAGWLPAWRSSRRPSGSPERGVDLRMSPDSVDRQNTIWPCFSLVEHSVRDRGVGRSNPLAPTTKNSQKLDEKALELGGLFSLYEPSLGDVG